MPTYLKGADIAQLAAAAGFKGSSLNIAVAVALAESSGDPRATGYNTDGSVDRGLWQINSVHSQYSASQLLDPSYNARAAFQVSNGGTNWYPWTTFKSGAYRKNLQDYTGSVGGSTIDPKAVTWLTLPVFQGNKYVTVYRGPNTDTPHYAWDMQTPFHTALTSPVNGTVVQADFAAWGGELFILPDHDNPGPTPQGAQWYIYHLDTIVVKKGDHVSIGQLLGLSGGQVGYGSHPVQNTPDKTWSTGPHTHTGWFSRWLTTPQGTLPYGPDPGPYVSYITSAVAKGTLPNYLGSYGNYTTTPSGGGGTDTSLGFVPLMAQVHATLFAHPGFYGIALAVNEAEQFPGWIDLTKPQHVTIGGGALGGIAGDIGFDMPDVAGIVRSVGATLGDNFVPINLRGMTALAGFILCLMLLLKAIGKDVGELLPLLVGA